MGRLLRKFFTFEFTPRDFHDELNARTRDNQVIVCPRVQGEVYPKQLGDMPSLEIRSDSVHRVCAECGELIWVSPSSVEMNKVSGAPFWCLHCTVAFKDKYETENANQGT